MSLRPAHRILLRAAAARPLIAAPRIFAAAQQRWNSSSDIPEPANTRPSKPLTQAPANAGPAATPLEQPSYQLTFTCRPCQTRSTHNVTKQAYHGGTVLIQCPGCKNRHVIADHLKIFGNTRRTLEDILNEAGTGEILKRARMLENGDIEMLPDEPQEADVEEPKSLS